MKMLLHMFTLPSDYYNCIKLLESTVTCVISFDLLPGENVEAKPKSFCRDAPKHASKDKRVFPDLLYEVVQKWPVRDLTP